jgi:hypothetical protein
LEVKNKVCIFAAENNRASEYRVGLQFRREGFRGPVFLLFALPNRELLVYLPQKYKAYVETEKMPLSH